MNQPSDIATIREALKRLQWYGIYRVGRGSQKEMENMVWLSYAALEALERISAMLAECQPEEATVSA